MPRKVKRGGGGGGGGKGGRTEEEKLVYQQQRAQAEEETTKKKEEILALFLKDKLQKEENNTSVNLLKLGDGWRSILRQTRASELRTDIDVLSQTFDRQLDAVDDVIKRLERDLQEAEHQAAQVQQLHLQHVERLRAQQEKQLMVLQRQWEEGLQHLSCTFNSDRSQMQQHSRQQRADLEDAKFTVEQQHEAVMNDILRLYSESIAAYESAHEERRAALLLEGSMLLKEKTRQKQETLQLHHKEATELDELLLKNQQLIQTSDRSMRRLRKLQDSMFQLRMKLKSSQTEKELVERDLTAATYQVNQRTRKLRDQLTRGQSAARKHLADLSVQSNAAAKKLQEVIAKGDRVLRVAEMCRKLEKEFLSSDEDRPTSEEEAAEDTCEFADLWRLTRLISAALLHREVLKKRRDDLSRENRQLKVLLRQHLEAVTLGDHSLGERHALLTVTQAPTTTGPSDANRRHTVIEAAHAVRQTLGPSFQMRDG
ncbi:dynein regulatory complex subunit 2 [Hippoglossus stenolepis]|uniref:dynein regulatory complex subunit 2 n=1 Tax=Hippoglossus stenolepis TaxID=195615 RepID=UPI00159C2872|nr:dynein regulatory complex subunit 2 [Hippoglossus stenolepis]XP_035024713.1 dynein regulatory complex subunit 2 [Hippoglossus stenolepis]XP_035024714.1 dynein regulatory complex subunit 2 [Hippoglossus stenolepis]